MKKLILTILLGGLMMTGAFANPSTGSGTVAFVYFSARNYRAHGKKCR